MFTVCFGLVFRTKHVQFPIICSLQYSININTVEVDPHSDLLHICIVKPKNSFNPHMGKASYNLVFVNNLTSALLFVIECACMIFSNL